MITGKQNVVRQAEAEVWQIWNVKRRREPIRGKKEKWPHVRGLLLGIMAFHVQSPVAGQNMLERNVELKKFRFIFSLHFRFKRLECYFSGIRSYVLMGTEC